VKKFRRVVARDRVHAGVIALLFASAFVFGQGTMEKVPDEEASRDSPGLHSPGSRLMAQVGEIEVLNGPVSFHTRNYLSFGVLANVRANWQRALSEKGLIPTDEQKVFTVEFTILKDGTLDSRKLVESSGDPELDGTGLAAVAKSAPFTAVPEEFSGEYLELRCHFYLNPGRRIPSMSRAGRGAGWTDTAGNVPAAGEGVGTGTGVGVSVSHGNGGPTKPRPIYAPDPEYSEQARKAGVQGTITLKVTVDANGDVADVKLVKGMGSGLDEKAIEAVRTWKFRPGTEDGTPVRSEIDVEVSFHLFNQR
jgi:TonB family protein